MLLERSSPLQVSASSKYLLEGYDAEDAPSLQSFVPLRQIIYGYASQLSQQCIVALSWSPLTRIIFLAERQGQA